MEIARHRAAVASFFYEGERLADPALGLIQPSPVPGDGTEMVEAVRHCGAVAQFLENSKGLAVPVFGLIQPSTELGGGTELVVNGADAGVNPFGFGLILQ